MDNVSKIIDKIYFVFFVFISLNFVSTYETTHTKKREKKTEKNEDSDNIDKKKTKKGKKKSKKNVNEINENEKDKNKVKKENENFDINNLEDIDLTLPSLDKIMENSGAKYKPLDYKYYRPFMSDISIGIETIGLFRSLIYLIKYPPKTSDDKNKEKSKYFDYDVQLHFNTKLITGSNFVIGADYGWQLSQIHKEKNKFTTKGVFLEPQLGFKQEYNIIESIIYSINFGIAFPTYTKYEQLNKDKNNEAFNEILKDDKSVPMWLGLGITAEKKLFYNFYGSAQFCLNYLIKKTKYKEGLAIPNFGRACNTINFNFNLFIQYTISMKDRSILI